LPRLEQDGINIKVVSAISEALFQRQSREYQDSVFPIAAAYDLMVVSTGTRRVWPCETVGPLTDEYSLVSDWHDEWLTGGTESDVIAEAHLDTESIYQGIKRFARDHDGRISRQTEQLTGLAKLI
jgi:transketolase